MVIKSILIFFLHFCLFVSMVFSQPTEHSDNPGTSPMRFVFISDSGILRLKEAVKEKNEPVYPAFAEVLKLADQNLERRPATPKIWYVPGYYNDAGGHRKAKNGLRDDANIAYAMALCFRITGEAKYAHSAIRLINAWVSMIDSMSQEDDSALSFSYHFPALIFAADLLRNKDVWPETKQKQFSDFLRYRALPMSTLDRENNWGNWGLVLSAACAVYLKDPTLFKTCVERWKYFIEHQIANDGHLPHEVTRREGKSGIWYSHFCLMPQTIAAEILRINGQDLFMYRSPSGHTLKQAFFRIAEWTRDPGKFPYWDGDPEELSGRYYLSYFEILNTHWENEDAVELLRRFRPLSADHSAPFLTFTHGKQLAEKKIPFPEALAGAAVKVDKLDDTLNGALIIGNGDINALVYSDSASIVLSLTKNDVWDARLETVNDPPIPTLQLIKELAVSDSAFPLRNNNSSYVLPEGMIWEAKDSYHSTPYPCPRQCARLIIPRKEALKELTGILNLQQALATVRELRGRVVNIRALADRNVFLVETPDQVFLEEVISADLPEAVRGETNNVVWLKQQIPGDLDWPGMAFVVALASNKNMKAIAIVSSLESGDIINEAVKLAKQTATSEPARLIGNHVSVWEKFWSRSGVSFDDSFLQTSWYRSLYFLRCFSKPGAQSVGLFAGLINDTPAWHGDYHTNYNIQQTYWTAYPTNHPELAEPYDRLMSGYLTRAKWLSRQVFSIDGAYYPHVMYAYENGDPTMSRSRNGRQYIHHVWGMTLGVNGFSIQPMWWRYKYDPDPERLEKKVYPVLREVAVFYAGFIEQCKGGDKVHLGPSVSPEHWGWTKNLRLNYNGTFDIALIRYTLKAAIEAAQTLNVDESLVRRFKKALQHLPDYPLSAEEHPVVVDMENAPPVEYNIPVPSTPVFPGDVVTCWSPEKEKRLFVRTIEGLRWNGNNATFMLAIARARLSLPGSQEWLKAEIEARMRPNGFIALNTLIPYHRFNDFGHYTEQFAAGMAISELLLQSVGDIIRIFPALSPGIRARFVDLRAQGGFLVSAGGTSGNVAGLQIKSIYGGALYLLSPWPRIEGRAGDKDYLPIKTDQRGVLTIQTRAGEVWQFRSF